MSLQELPGSFGVIFQAFSLPMEAERSRNKKRLEASLAGLCELELLKQRQECRVLSALCLGDSTVTGRPPWGTRRSARCNSLHCTPWGIKSSLEQQVAELKVNTEVKSAELRPDLEDKRLNSGETETRESWHSDTRRKATVTDVLREMKDVNSSLEDCQQAQKLETYIFGLIQCRALPIRPSKPHTSLTHYARAVTVVRQSSLCCKEEQHSPKQVSVQLISTLSHCSEGTVPKVYHNPDQEHYLELELNEEEVPPPYHHHLLQSVQYQPRFIRKPMQASMVSMSGSTSPDYTSCSMLQANKDSNNSETDSPQHFLNYQAVPVHSKPHHPPSLDEQLVNAEYIPANPCRASTRAFAHHHSNPHKGSGVPKPNKSMFSPEQSHHNEEQQPTVSQILPSRCRGGAKKCHLSEDRICASRKTGKKAGRSQSGNSQQRVPERKYNTVERDGGGSGSGGRGSCNSQSRSKKQQQGSGSYRRWQSSLELSQDEADQPPIDQCARKTLKSRSSHASHAYPHRNHHHPQSQHHQDMECHLERDKVPLCKPSEDYPHQGRRESESSMSEADSPDSSSLSSDSDESGGLVWPQQLPPQLSLPSPLAPPGATMQPKAFVKIKASHALKKKILRFRTGSLKVMTTV
uniref:Dapper 1-like n=1 Tax=Scophthalmus maximus TaxID=52904 RepID=A0A8D3B0T8_SCOMX